MTEVPNSEPKYEATDAVHAALNGQAPRRRVKPVAPRFNDTKPGDADRATTEIPNSEPKNKSTAAERAALNGKARQRREPPFARRRNEAGSRDADRAATEVPKSEPKYEPTDAKGAALNGRAQRQKEPPAAPRLNEAGSGDADRAMTEVPKSEPEYELTDDERAVREKQAQRRKERPLAPRLKVVTDDRGQRVVYDHPNGDVAGLLFKEAFGTADDDFYQGLLAQLGVFEDDGDLLETELNFELSTIINEKPKDQLHGMLLAQTVKGHMVYMKLMRNFYRIQKQYLRLLSDVAEKNPYLVEKNALLAKNLSLLLDNTARSVNQFARTFCMQFDALNRYRRIGGPSMTVQQLTVAPGGQAIVGHVTHSTSQTAPINAAAARGAVTDQQHSAMPIIGEPDRVAVPARRQKKQ